MFRTGIIAIAAVGAFSVGDIPTASAAANCTSIQARCAVEIGGRCDPATGRWEYGRNGAGGNTAAFNACVSRELARRK